jgi:hypothetical protein
VIAWVSSSDVAYGPAYILAQGFVEVPAAEMEIDNHNIV